MLNIERQNYIRKSSAEIWSENNSAEKSSRSWNFERQKLYWEM